MLYIVYTYSLSLYSAYSNSNSILVFYTYTYIYLRGTRPSRISLYNIPYTVYTLFLSLSYVSISPSFQVANKAGPHYPNYIGYKGGGICAISIERDERTSLTEMTKFDSIAPTTIPKGIIHYAVPLITILEKKKDCCIRHELRKMR